MIRFLLCSLLLLWNTKFISCKNSENGNQEMSDRKLKIELEKYIDAQNGTVAVSLSVKHKQYYLGINDTISMHAASTMKVPVMIEIFNQAQSGKFNLDDSIVVKNEFKSIIDGSPYSMDIQEDSGDRLYSMIGKKESIRSLVVEMIIYSGNLATNLLIDLAGAKNVQEKMEKLGAKDIRVLRGVEDIKAYRAGKSNTTTAKDLTIILQSILDGKSGTPEHTKEMINILLNQKFNDKLPAKLPDNVKVAHKTGSITAINHDCGIIYPPGKQPYVLTVLTKGFQNPQDAKTCIADISKMIYDWYIMQT